MLMQNALLAFLNILNVKQWIMTPQMKTSDKIPTYPAILQKDYSINVTQNFAFYFHNVLAINSLPSRPITPLFAQPKMQVCPEGIKLTSKVTSINSDVDKVSNLPESSSSSSGRVGAKRQGPTGPRPVVLLATTSGESGLGRFKVCSGPLVRDFWTLRYQKTTLALA